MPDARFLDFATLRRARVVLDWQEQGERMHWSGDAWARVEGPWVHLLADEVGHWQSWPMTNVTCVDWEGDASS